jgi:hypothetical protein
LFLTLKNGLVACYPFEGDAMDKSGNSNNGVIHGGVTPAVDRFGNPNSAYSFGTGNAYIEIPGSQFNFPENMTVAFWMNPNPIQTDWNFIFDKVFDASSGHRQGWWINQNSGSTNQYLFNYVYSSGSQGSSPATTNLVENSWTHVAFVKSGKRVYYYKNGALTGTSATLPSATIISSGDLPLVIGGGNGDHSNPANNVNVFFSGVLDDIFIYGRSLDASEVQQLYSLSPATFTGLNNGLVLYLPFSGIYDDQSGNNLPVRNFGATFTADRFGVPNSASALTSNTSLVVAAHSLLNIGTSDFTLAAWVKPDVPTSNGRFISHGAGSVGYMMRYNTNEKVQYNLVCSPGVLMIVNGLTTVSPGLWHSVVLTGRRSGNAILYVNGAVDNSASFTIGACDLSVPANMPLYIGRQYNEQFSGAIDEVRIYNRALTAAEVLQLYHDDMPTGQPTSYPSAVPKFIGRSLPLSTLTATQGVGFYDSKVLPGGWWNILGIAVTKAGDVNSDGIDDFLISSFSTNNANYGQYGVVHLVYGNRNLHLLPSNLLNATVSQCVKFTASQYNYIGGSSKKPIASVGDMNKDGFDDMLIAARGYSGSFENGEAFIVFGSNNLTNLNLDLLTAQRGIIVRGNSVASNLGCSVTGLDDFNGDGFPDAAISSHYYPSSTKFGLVAIIYGSRSMTNIPVVNSLTSKQGVLIVGARANSFFGSFLVGVGDFNGDGSPDLLASTSSYFDGTSFSQGYYLIYGGNYTSPSNKVNITQLIQSQSAIALYGLSSNDFVADKVNINNDPLMDIVIGSMPSKKACVVYGTRNRVHINLVALTVTQGFCVLGSSANIIFYQVSGIGDFNSDGFDDFALGDKGISSGNGAVYVIYGGRNLTSIDLSSGLPDSRGFTVVGYGAGNIGSGLGGGGDFNHDGHSDLLIGAPNIIQSSSAVGKMFVVYGGQSFPTSQPTTQPSRQPTRQPSSQPSFQPGSVPTAQPSRNPTRQPSSQPSSQPSNNPSSQPTRKPSSQPTSRPSNQPLSLPTDQPSRRPSSQPSSLPSGQPSRVPTSQPMSKPSSQPSEQPSSVPSGQPSRQPSCQPALQPIVFPTRNPTSQPSTQPSFQPSRQPNSVPTGQPTGRPSALPSSQPTLSPTGQPSTFPTSQPSGNPSSQPFSTPTAQPSSSPTTVPTAVPTEYPSSQPFSQPTSEPTSQPSRRPTSFPTGPPSAQPTAQPTTQPLSIPSSLPSSQRTSQPSSLPSTQPSVIPSILPSSIPTRQPSIIPSSQPSLCPTSVPSSQPTGFPSSKPTTQPFTHPSSSPSCIPTVVPSRSLSSQPSSSPSGRLTDQPSALSSRQPSTIPSTQPTAVPTGRPSRQPTTVPTSFLTSKPTIVPSLEPFSAPTSRPSIVPSVQPSSDPTEQPSSRSTDEPSSQPTQLPSTSLHSVHLTNEPSVSPANSPSIRPSSYTSYPSVAPSRQPTRQPSSPPSSRPSLQPTKQPVVRPTSQPSQQPVSRPTSHPSTPPTSYPTSFPTQQPTCQPSSHPSSRPSLQPTKQPVARPTSQPSQQPDSRPTSRPSSKPTILSMKPTSPLPPSISAFPTHTSKPTRLPTNKPTFRPTASPTSTLSIYPLNTKFQSYLFLLGVFQRTAELETTSVQLNGPSVGTSFMIFGRRKTFSMEDIVIGSRESLGLYTDMNDPTGIGGYLTRDSMTRSVTNIGDINKDSLDDLLVCNPVESVCYLYFGKSNRGFENLQVSLSIIYSLESSSSVLLGWSVAGIGDMNGDGFNDFMISVLIMNTVFVVYGRASFTDDIILSQLTKQEGFKITTSNQQEQVKSLTNLGISLASLGDYNGDGFSDLAITVMNAQSTQNYIFIVFGNNETFRNDLHLSISDSSPPYYYSRIITASFSFAGFSVAGLGDVNGDGLSDLAIGSLPYQGGYSTQRTYILFGKKKRANNEDFYLSNMRSNGFDGFIITGGGFMVVGPGDVNNDGLADIMISSYSEWQSQGNPYVMIYPKNNVTSPPTFPPTGMPSDLPSSSPSAVPTIRKDFSSENPTNLPSLHTIQPTNRIVPLPPDSTRSPTLFPQITSTKPTKLPSFRPSTLTPTKKPSPKPSYKPSFLPSVSPSLLPSKTSAPSLSPTVKPSINFIPPFIFPSSSPSVFPTPPSSSVYETTVITDSGSYDLPDGQGQLIISGAGSIVVTGNDGRKIYKIIPAENKITITDFDNHQDMLDLSLFSPLLRTVKDVTYTTNPLIFYLSEKQILVLSSHEEFDLTEKNFIFSSSVSSSSSEHGSLLTGYTLDVSFIASISILLSCVLLVCGLICLPIYGTKDADDDENIKVYPDSESEIEEEVDTKSRKGDLETGNNTFNISAHKQDQLVEEELLSEMDSEFSEESVLDESKNDNDESESLSFDLSSNESEMHDEIDSHQENDADDGHNEFLLEESEANATVQQETRLETESGKLSEESENETALPLHSFDDYGKGAFITRVCSSVENMTGMELTYPDLPNRFAGLQRYCPNDYPITYQTFPSWDPNISYHSSNEYNNNSVPEAEMGNNNYYRYSNNFPVSFIANRIEVDNDDDTHAGAYETPPSFPTAANSCQDHASPRATSDDSFHFSRRSGQQFQERVLEHSERNEYEKA